MARARVEDAEARFDFGLLGKRTAMVGELVMLPVRVGVRATRLWLRALEETVSATSAAAGRLIELVGSRGSGGAVGQAPRQNDVMLSQSESEADAFITPEPEPAPPGEPGEPMQPLRPAPPSDAFAAAKPRHVSEEPTLVEEFAEAGAEDGAGAEVRVDPPWDGYEQMNAKEIVARLGDADAAELGAVELYEAATRRRRTILNAVERELRRVNGSGSRRNQSG